jgi:putative ABC transport system permease protein
MWFRALVRPSDGEREMQREFAVHLAMEQQRLEDAGMPADEARRQARIAFGGVERHKESVRDERGLRFLDDTSMDVRVAIRSLRRRPAFSGGVIATLAIGIGATTAVFSWANWLLLRPVPGITAPADLVPFVSDLGVSFPDFVTVQRSAPILRNMIAHADWPIQIGRADAPARSLSGDVVAGNYFGVLGVTPTRGRFFAPTETQSDVDARVVIISDALWRSHFGATADIVGRRVVINAATFTVIGVASPAFRGTDRIRPVDVWLPVSAYAVLRHSPGLSAADPKVRLLDEIIVRVGGRDGAAAALAALRRAMGALPIPEGGEGYVENPPTINGVLGTPTRGYDRKVENVRLMFGIVGLVLLIACGNTANLLLLRSVRRRGEFAVRRALGASAGRVLQQHLVEGVLLAALGGCAGIGLSVLLGHLFAGITGYGLPQFDRIPLDWRVIGFAATLTLTTGLMYSLAPGLMALRRDGLTHLRTAGRGGYRAAPRVRSALTALQVGASVTLVIGAVLLARSVGRLHRVPLGFDAAGVTTFNIYTDPQGYSAARLHPLRVEAIGWMAHQRGIVAAASASAIPFGNSYELVDLRTLGSTGKNWPVTVIANGVSPDYFKAMGIAVLAGRTFAAAEFDDSTSDAVVLSQSAARTLFGPANPIGARIERRIYRGTVPLTVVGVVSDTRATSLRGGAKVTAYMPWTESNKFGTTLVVRSSLAPAQVQRLVSEELGQFDPSLPVSPMESLTQSVNRSIAPERLFGRLLGVLAVIAGLLSAVGLYSVVAYSVMERTREIGVRVALGARETRIVAMILRQGAHMAVAGVLVGVAGAYALSHVLSGMLFGVAPTDPSTYVTAAIVALAVCAGACAIPARAATKINPVEALRSE